MDEAIAAFTSFTGQTEDVARRYLGMTDNNPEQAVSLFFEAPDLGGSNDNAPQQSATAGPTSTRPVPSSTRPREDSDGVVHLDSDDDDMDMGDDNFGEEDNAAAQAAALARAADVEDDEAMARRMQEELYAGADSSGGFDADGVRAPIARTTETLVGGPGGWEADDMHDTVLEQIRARAQGRAASGSARAGIFNQRTAPSIWDQDVSEGAHRQGLAEATGGQSESSSKNARLAELFRPPFELMCRLPWDAARDQGKEEGKWILVNIQDNSIFDCQQLNRDIWKNPGIRDVVKENFIFMQYSKDDPRGNQYVQYYFPLKDSDAAYPHIAIVDPRTGEQVKVWSGPPPPQPAEFLMQLVEFLDRYSLDLSKKNPVARRKPEKSKSVDIERLTEQEMLDLAMQNSLANSGSGPKEDDPDDLTKSFGEIGKGKGKAVEDEAAETVQENDDSAFSHISSDKPHNEPEGNADTTRIQFRHSNGRVVRKFKVDDSVRRIYEWLKADPIDGKTGVPFELKLMGKDLIESLDETISSAGLKNSTVMVEFIEE
ncbi:UBX domain-containing protein [Rutstroemia sp. NJR-2017a BVV2]|nr:UBX domain-containing protein [Rutstroemia sp. NJR-2017a BVV2]